MTRRIPKKVFEKKQQKLIAKDSMKSMLLKADFAAQEGNLLLANRYVTLSRKISMKFKIRFPREFKRKFCKHCYKYLKPSVTSRVRIQHGKVIIACLLCKKFMRFELIEKKKKVRTKKKRAKSKIKK